jgi:hypothetical protein
MGCEGRFLFFSMATLVASVYKSNRLFVARPATNLVIRCGNAHNLDAVSPADSFRATNQLGEDPRSHGTMTPSVRARRTQQMATRRPLCLALSRFTKHIDP